MIFATCFETNDLRRAGVFDDKVLSNVGFVRLETNENEVGYGAPGYEDHAPGYCGAYCRDPDLYKLYVFARVNQL